MCVALCTPTQKDPRSIAIASWDEWRLFRFLSGDFLRNPLLSAESSDYPATYRHTTSQKQQNINRRKKGRGALRVLSNPLKQHQREHSSLYTYR